MKLPVSARARQRWPRAGVYSVHAGTVPARSIAARRRKHMRAPSGSRHMPITPADTSSTTPTLPSSQARPQPVGFATGAGECSRFC